MPVVDAHVHVAALPGLKLNREEWLGGFATGQVPGLYDDSGQPQPAVMAEYLAAEGVDVALLFAEYSPRVTGWQRVEDMLPFLRHDPHRFRLVGNVNPHLHYPLRAEVSRQLDLGAVALKLHPVHAGFAMDTPELYPVYALCELRDVAVVVHAGTSNFPGAQNRYADLGHLVDVVRDFPGVRFVLSHGGRGWSYDTAAFLAMTYPNVWIDIAGLPPRRIPGYFPRQDFPRLATRFVFGSDWPGLPGIARNLAELRRWELPEATWEAMTWRTANDVYRLGLG